MTILSLITLTSAAYADELSLARPANPHRAMLRLEVGTVFERSFVGATAGQPESTGRIPVGGAIEGQGVAIRMIMGVRGWYGGVDASLVALRSGPDVVMPMTFVDGKPVDLRPRNEDDVWGNSSVSARAIVGREVRLGRLALGGELGIGMGSVTVGGETARAPWVDDTRFLFDARARAGFWVTRNVNVSVLGSAGIARDEDRSIALLLGGTPFTFDGL